MKPSVSKSSIDLALDAFTEAAAKAMRRAHRVAAKENARYGLAAVVERPRSSSRKTTATRSRRVKELV